ncbi:MAG: GlcNAc-PI de-N-acetylase [Chloroflexi bacterium]|nr:GlcNAc-PI de-N-acetylase [Chloroflexota bacterium]|tara:strand:+ start:22 stop:792 length:771 start_codon:yes stop_codon:yes gene_type:complete
MKLDKSNIYAYGDSMKEKKFHNEYSRGMVVVAHPDDAEYGSSGTVARLIREGWEFVYVMCTDGSKGSSEPDMTQSKLSKIRKEEQINAGKVLGLKDIVFLDYEDSYLTPNLDVRKDIAREIRRHKPDIVICQYPMRNLDGSWGVGHPDHIAAGEATLSAIFPTARDRLTFPELLESGLEPHKVAEAWIFGHPEPDLWIDVSAHIETSIDALMQHVSQLPVNDREIVSKRMKDWRSERAKGKGMQYAESFKKIPFSR